MASGISTSNSADRAQIVNFALAALVIVLALASTFFAVTGLGSAALLAVAGVASAVLIVRYPFLGVLIYLVTFLFTYPSALRGYGNLTINNMLGLLMVPLMLYGTLREGLGWFLKARPLLYLILVGVILLTAGRLYNTQLPVEGRKAVELKRGFERSEFGARRFEGEDIVATREPAIKFITRFVFLLFFVFFVRTPGQLKAVVALLIGVLLATYFNLSAEAGPFGWGRGRLRVVGTPGTALYTGTNPNKLAFYALFVLTLLWYMRTRIKSALVYPLWAIATAIAAVIIPLTASRSGFLNLLVFVTIVLLEGRFSLRKVLGVALLAMVAIVQLGYGVSIIDVVLPGAVSERITEVAPGKLLEEGELARGSFRRRFQSALAAAWMVGHNPLFGVGLDNYQNAREALEPTADIGPPHNSYLSATTEGGIVTLGLYLAMFVWIIRRLHELTSDYSARFGPVDMEWLVRAMRTTMVLFLLFSFVADVWVNIFFHTIVGLALCTIQLHRTYAETGRVPGSPLGSALGGGGALR